MALNPRRLALPTAALLLSMALATPALADAPQISSSRGQAGGVVLLWPRIIPRAIDHPMLALATRLQTQMKRIVLATLPGMAGRLDVRPAPQRVCPQAGCKALSFGLLLLHEQGGCHATALISPPGRSPARLISWSGDARVKRPTLAFREAPETAITVRDFVPCDRLAAPTAKAEKQIAEALRRAVVPAR